MRHRGPWEAQEKTDRREGHARRPRTGQSGGDCSTFSAVYNKHHQQGGAFHVPPKRRLPERGSAGAAYVGRKHDVAGQGLCLVVSRCRHRDIFTTRSWGMMEWSGANVVLPDTRVARMRRAVVAAGNRSAILEAVSKHVSDVHAAPSDVTHAEAKRALATAGFSHSLSLCVDLFVELVCDRSVSRLRRLHPTPRSARPDGGRYEGRFRYGKAHGHGRRPRFRGGGGGRQRFAAVPAPRAVVVHPVFSRGGAVRRA